MLGARPESPNKNASSRMLGIFNYPFATLLDKEADKIQNPAAAQEIQEFKKRSVCADPANSIPRHQKSSQTF